jgi:hypothetical protein
MRRMAVRSRPPRHNGTSRRRDPILLRQWNRRVNHGLSTVGVREAGEVLPQGGDYMPFGWQSYAVMTA